MMAEVITTEEHADEVICDCSGTTRSKIDSLINQGIDSLDAISRKTGAISGCGSCEWDIADILNEHQQSGSS